MALGQESVFLSAAFQEVVSETWLPRTHSRLTCSVGAFSGVFPRSPVRPGLAMPSVWPGEQRLRATLPWAHTLISAAQEAFPARRFVKRCELDGSGVNCDWTRRMSRRHLPGVFLRWQRRGPGVTEHGSQAAPQAPRRERGSWRGARLPMSPPGATSRLSACGLSVVRSTCLPGPSWAFPLTQSMCHGPG